MRSFSADDEFMTASRRCAQTRAPLEISVEQLREADCFAEKRPRDGNAVVHEVPRRLSRPSSRTAFSFMIRGRT
jgi:hypothetical protein